MDYQLYEHFRDVLLEEIAKQGEDFSQEMDQYEQYQDLSAAYCEVIYKEMRQNTSNIYSLHRLLKPLVLPETKWGPSVEIDPVWCLVSRIDTSPFNNIVRVKQLPQICQHIDLKYPDVNTYRFGIRSRRRGVIVLPEVCAKNPENTLVPLDLLATKKDYMYMWS